MLSSAAEHRPGGSRSMLREKDPFESAERRADRLARFRMKVADMSDGDGIVWSIPVGTLMMVSGALMPLFELFEAGVVMFGAGALAVLGSGAVMLGFPAVLRMERWYVRRFVVGGRRMTPGRIPLDLLGRAMGHAGFARSYRNGGPPALRSAPSSFEVTQAVAARMVSDVTSMEGGQRVVDLLMSLGHRLCLTEGDGAEVSELAGSLLALDDERFSILLALAHIEARRESDDRTASFSDIVARLSLRVARMDDTDLLLCTSIIHSTRWDGSADELIDAASCLVE